MSRRFLEICGLPPNSRLGTRADFTQKFPFFPPERDEVVRKFTALFASRATRLELDMHYMRGEKVRWLHIGGVCTRRRDGGLLRWTSSATDITDLKRAEEALAKSEERFMLAAAASAGGIWDCDIASDAMFL
jgi:PAS domain-containing protein